MSGMAAAGLDGKPSKGRHKTGNLAPMEVRDLVRDFSRPPTPWSEGRTIPWNDPGFSRRMLREHLSQQHDAASRRTETVLEHIAFITKAALPMPPARVLDLGCGPGLYALGLARTGYECHGIDFAPAAIDYARSEAQLQGTSCSFELGDIRETPFGAGFDLVMLLYGELNMFPREEAVELLRRCGQSLRSGGLVLLEVHSFEAVKRRGDAGTRWSAWETGLFADSPHLRLEESFWLDEGKLSAGRYWIVDAEGKDVERYGWTMQAYDDSGYASLLADADLRLREGFPSLTGRQDEAGFPVLLAQPD